MAKLERGDLRGWVRGGCEGGAGAERRGTGSDWLEEMLVWLLLRMKTARWLGVMVGTVERRVEGLDVLAGSFAERVLPKVKREAMAWRCLILDLEVIWGAGMALSEFLRELLLLLQLSAVLA